MGSDISKNRKVSEADFLDVDTDLDMCRFPE